MADLARRFLVTGMVQGVGYRAFVRRKARGLGIAGYAENLADGSVLVIARGPSDALDELQRALNRGPAYARVSQVVATDVAAAEVETGSFGIR